MSKKKPGFTIAEVTLPDDLANRIADVCPVVGQSRNQWLLEAATQRLHGASGALSHTNFPATVVEVLKVTNGKLSRLEAEHLVALVITEMAK